MQSNIPPHWNSDEMPSREVIAQALRCPFARRLNPNVDQAHEQSSRWVRANIPDSRMAERLTQARMAWMVAGFFPSAGVEELSLAADYISWAFALDDLGDETELGKNPILLARLFETFDAVFEGPARALESASVRGLRNIVSRLSKLATPQQLAAFHAGNLAYFGGMLWEANNRAGAWVPNESSFLTLRPAAGAVPPFMALIEPLERLTLPVQVRNHPHVEELTRLAGGILCWTNDVLSYEKERAQGDVHNLAIVYEVQRGLTRGAALTQAVAFHNAEVDGFLARAAALPALNLDSSGKLQRYVQVLCSMMRITRDWTLGSARYADADQVEVAISA
jgi:Terpene synthase family 2, C-terminal metal binding